MLWAQTYRGLGLHERAEKMHVEAHTVWESALGPDHPDTLASQNNLALDLPGRRPHCRGNQIARDDAQDSRRRSSAPITFRLSRAALTSPWPMRKPDGYMMRSR